MREVGRGGNGGESPGRAWVKNSEPLVENCAIAKLCLLLS